MEKIKYRMAQSRASFKETVNEALRAGLLDTSRERSQKPFRVKARDLGLRSNLSYDNVEDLLDQLDGANRR
jgi:hypothetical protein